MLEFRDDYRSAFSPLQQRAGSGARVFLRRLRLSDRGVGGHFMEMAGNGTRLALLLFLFGNAMQNISAAELKVDHVTVAARDLAQLRARFAAAGLHSEYGGKHTNGLTEMAIISFADGSYLELIAAQSPSKGAASHDWGRFIDGNAGPCAWAVRVTDIANEAAKLKATVQNGGRKREDGVELEWKTAAPGPGPHGSFFPFLIEDGTARELRVFPHGSPTEPKIAGVARVLIGVRNLDEAVARYRNAFAWPEPERSIDKALGARLAHFVGTPVVLATPEGRWLADRLETFGEAPFAFVLGRESAGPVRWLPIEGMRIGLLPD